MRDQDHLADGGTTAVCGGEGRTEFGAIICSFSSGLDDLTRAQQADALVVLRVLAKTKRYSAFEASDNMVIARMMTRLHHKGLTIVKDGVRTEYGQLIKTVGGAYPWTEIELTEGGLRYLTDNQSAPGTVRGRRPLTA